MKSLATLGLTSDKFAVTLFPIVESYLPEELLRVWQRRCSTYASTGNEQNAASSKAKDQLNLLIDSEPM